MGSKYRNAALTVAVTGALIASVVLLIPSAAAAVQITPTAVSTLGAAPNYEFTVTADVLIPQGEHIPLDHVEVHLGSALDGSNNAQDDVCDAQTGGPATATIISVSGGSSVLHTFSGYGYNIESFGYGYGYTYGSSQSTVDFSGFDQGYGYGTGYGYGYGEPTQDTRLTVTIQVSGCTNLAATNPNYGADHLFTAHLQVLLGGDAGRVFYSVPAPVTFLEPGFTPSGDAEGPVLTPSSLTQQSGITTAGFLFSTTNGGVLSSSQSALVTFTQFNSYAKSMTITGGPNGLPHGSQILLRFSDSLTGASPSLSSPAFGQDPSRLAAVAQTGSAPAIFFSVDITGLPAGADINQYLGSLSIDLEVPYGFFTGISAGWQAFRLVAFNADGTAKTGAGALIAFSNIQDTGSAYRFTFDIDRFSSFAGVGASIGGGGGGGGGAVTTTSTSATTTDTTTDTATATATETTTETTSKTVTGTGTGAGTGTDTGTAGTEGPDDEGGNNQTPGFGVLALLAATGTALAVVRRRL